MSERKEKKKRHQRKNYRRGNLLENDLICESSLNHNDRKSRRRGEREGKGGGELRIFDGSLLDRVMFIVGPDSGWK